MNEHFQINSPDIDSAELLQKVEQRLTTLQVDAAEIEWVRSLSYRPDMFQGGSAFDPAETSELFERPVRVPDFKNRKFRFLPGPIRKVIGSLFRLFLKLDTKLSENRTEAFYNVIHALIALDHKYRDLRLQMMSLASENQKLRNLISRHDHHIFNSADTATDTGRPILSSNDGMKEPDLAEEYRELMGHCAQYEAPAVVLDSPEFATLLESSRLPVFSNCLLDSKQKARQFETGQNFDSSIANMPADLFLYSLEDSLSGMIVIPDVQNLSGTVESLPELIVDKLAPNGACIIRIKASQESPLRRNRLIEFDREALEAYFLSRYVECTHRHIEGIYETFVYKKMRAV